MASSPANARAAWSASEPTPRDPPACSRAAHGQSGKAPFGKSLFANAQFGIRDPRRALTALTIIVLFAFVVEATAGFGATVITLTLASHLMPIPAVLAALIPVNMLLSATLAIRYRREVDWGIVLRRGVMQMGLGALVGMALYQFHNQAWLKAAFAALVVVLSANELWQLRPASAPTSLPLSRARAAIATFAAGVIHGLFACGGPLLVYVVGRELPEKGRFRATLSAIWLALNGALLVNLSIAKDLSLASLKQSALLAIPLAVGLILGEHIHARIPAARFRVAVFTLLLLAGTSLFVRALWA
ncbi:MAG: sulfite exporter TauE/SafE family protein [Myxococcales bacterium]|nr:sulfite exporter TauE/SafE family protein [Myxococcales bacterium]